MDSSQRIIGTQESHLPQLMTQLFYIFIVIFVFLLFALYKLRAQLPGCSVEQKVRLLCGVFVQGCHCSWCVCYKLWVTIPTRIASGWLDRFYNIRLRWDHLVKYPEVDVAKRLYSHGDLPRLVVDKLLDSVQKFSTYCTEEGSSGDEWFEYDSVKLLGYANVCFPHVENSRWCGYNVSYSPSSIIFDNGQHSFTLPNIFTYQSFRLVYSDSVFMWLVEDHCGVPSISLNSDSVFRGLVGSVHCDYTWSLCRLPFLWKILYLVFGFELQRSSVKIAWLDSDVLVYKYAGDTCVSFMLANVNALHRMLPECVSQRFALGDFGKLSTMCRRHLINVTKEEHSLVDRYMYGTLYLSYVMGLQMNVLLFGALGDLKLLALDNSAHFDDWAYSYVNNVWAWSEQTVVSCAIVLNFVFLSYFIALYVFWCWFGIFFFVFAFYPFVFLLLLNSFCMWVWRAKTQLDTLKCGVLLDTVPESCQPSRRIEIRDTCSLDYIPGMCNECKVGAYVYAPCVSEHCTVASSCVHNGYTACAKRNVANFPAVSKCPEDFKLWADYVLQTTVNFERGSIKPIDDTVWARRFGGHKRELYEEAIRQDEEEGSSVMYSTSMEAFIKREIVLGKRKVDDSFEFTPRLIVASKSSYGAKLGAKIYTASKILKSAWGGGKCAYGNVDQFPGLYYTAGMNKTDLGALYDTMIDILGPDCYAGVFDFEKYDAHMQEVHLDSERRLYAKVFSEMSDSELKEFFTGLDAQMTRSGFIKCRDGILKARIHAARKSGDQNTSVGNSFLNVCLHTYALNKLGVDVFGLLKAHKMFIWVMGDDSLIWCHKDVVMPTIADYRDEMRKLGMEITGNYFSKEHVDYCSNIFIPAVEGTVATQFLGRNLCKAYVCLHKYAAPKRKFWVKQTAMAYKSDFNHVPLLAHYHGSIFKKVMDAKAVRIHMDEYDGKHVAHGSLCDEKELDTFLSNRYGLDVIAMNNLLNKPIDEILKSEFVKRLIEVDVYDNHAFGTRRPHVTNIQMANFLLMQAVDVSKLKAVDWRAEHKDKGVRKKAPVGSDADDDDDSSEISPNQYMDDKHVKALGIDSSKSSKSQRSKSFNKSNKSNKGLKGKWKKVNH